MAKPMATAIATTIGTIGRDRLASRSLGFGDEVDLFFGCWAVGVGAAGSALAGSGSDTGVTAGLKASGGWDGIGGAEAFG